VAASYAELTGKNLTAKQIFDPVGPKATTQMVFDIYCELAALALSTVINVIDPACIVLGGGVSNTDHLASAIQKRLLHYVFSDQVDTQVMAAHHGDASGVRGAAWLW
jgi:fructokinase